jgi:hypothetical protein
MVTGTSWRLARYETNSTQLQLGGILKSDEANCQIQNHEISNPDLKFHDFGFGSLLRPISKFLQAEVESNGVTG